MIQAFHKPFKIKSDSPEAVSCTLSERSTPREWQVSPARWTKMDRRAWNPTPQIDLRLRQRPSTPTHHRTDQGGSITRRTSRAIRLIASSPSRGLPASTCDLASIAFIFSAEPTILCFFQSTRSMPLTTSLRILLRTPRAPAKVGSWPALSLVRRLHFTRALG